ncbi:hypothetical protein [Roseovarius sp. 217]|uniref:hypothetical protein n=1 Tax=Roseovarius sp. (strain 217) TaxID=314264 RepID=UPI0000685D9B|nr:hypothetical protein [Roseovarius sp. 217]EAQ26068.1 hypothetical protein ROS217_12866 [Roseovarius sp. 217]
MAEEQVTEACLDHSGTVQRALDITIVAQAAVAKLVCPGVGQFLPHLGGTGGIGGGTCPVVSAAISVVPYLMKSSNTA